MVSANDETRDDSRPAISVVIPVYHAENMLVELCKRLNKTLTGMGESFEIVLVDDGSPDQSWEEMQRLRHEYPQLVCVKLSRNFGQHYAITAGMVLARGTWVVIMDCDLQDPPEEIPSLMEATDDEVRVVLARRIAKKHSVFKRFTSSLFAKTFSLLSGMHVDESVGCFRVMHRTAVDAFCGMSEQYRLFNGMVTWLGFETTYVDVQHGERLDGTTSYSFPKLFRLATDGIISFSNRPLYLSIAAGATLSTMSGAYATYLLASYLWFGPSPTVGWMSTITAIVFLGGLILFNQGVLGIYLGRLYNEAKGRPLYVVDRIETGSDVQLECFAQQQVRPVEISNQVGPSAPFPS